MEESRIHFYQTGTFTVGNRLLDEKLKTLQSSTKRFNSLESGHRACQGCGEHRRVGRKAAEAVKVPLGDPEPGHAVRVRPAGGVEDQVVFPRLPGFGRVVGKEEQAEFHDRT